MKRFTLEFETDGNADILNLASELTPHLKDLGDGLLHLFAIGSTAALTTIEFEPGLVKHDLREAMQRLIPDNIHYEHEATWNDDNGHSHLRASLIGPSLTVPIASGRLLLGEYQQICYIDFDTRPRRRKVIATFMGD